MSIRILTYSNLYPNAAQPTFGLFVEQRLLRLVQTGRVSSTVVAPVPWFPFRSDRFGRYGRLARVPAEERRQGVQVFHPRYPVIPRIGMNLASTLMARFTHARVARLIGRVQLIDAHYLYPDGVAAARLAQTFRKPLLLTARGSDVNVLMEYPVPRKRMLDAIACADGVVTVSRALKERLVALGVPQDAVTVLRNGVDRTFFQPLDRARIRADLGFAGHLILSVGNLVALKGHDLVIEAVAGLEQARLLVIGEGPERQRLEALAARLRAPVRFLGNLAPRELVRYYNAADVTVLASEREGMPNVLLESIACGTPVVATPVGGIPEVVTAPEAGVLLAARTAQDIAAGLAALLRDPPARERTRAFSARFDWDTTVNALADLIAGIVGGHAR